MRKFLINKFKDALKEQDILEIDGYEEIKDLNIGYIDFKNSNLKYIRVPLTYKNENNCINIYHDYSSKSGY